MLYDKRWEEKLIPVVPKPKKPRLKKWQTILYQAALILDKHWCRGSFHLGDNYCTLGAINKAAGYDPGTRQLEKVRHTPRTMAISKVCATLPSVTGYSITRWNDGYVKDGATAAAKLREVAAG